MLANSENVGRWPVSVLAFLLVVLWMATALLFASTYWSRRDLRDLVAHGQRGQALVKVVFPHQRHWWPGAADDTALISVVDQGGNSVDAWLPLSTDEATRLRHFGPGHMIDILYARNNLRQVATVHPVDHAWFGYVAALLLGAISALSSAKLWRRLRLSANIAE